MQNGPSRLEKYKAYLVHGAPRLTPYEEPFAQIEFLLDKVIYSIRKHLEDDNSLTRRQIQLLDNSASALEELCCAIDDCEYLEDVPLRDWKEFVMNGLEEDETKTDISNSSFISRIWATLRSPFTT